MSHSDPFLDSDRYQALASRNLKTVASIDGVALRRIKGNNVVAHVVVPCAFKSDLTARSGKAPFAQNRNATIDVVQKTSDVRS